MLARGIIAISRTGPECLFCLGGFVFEPIGLYAGLFGPASRLSGLQRKASEVGASEMFCAFSIAACFSKELVLECPATVSGPCSTVRRIGP